MNSTETGIFNDLFVNEVSQLINAYHNNNYAELAYISIRKHKISKTQKFCRISTVFFYSKFEENLEFSFHVCCIKMFEGLLSI